MASKVQQTLKDFFTQYPLISYRKGETIIEAEEDIESIFYLESGFVQQISLSPQGESITIHIFTPGSFFPLMILFNNTLNSYYFEALIDSKIRKANPQDIEKLLRKNPEILLDLTKRAFLGLAGLSKRIENLSFGSARERVISVVLYLAKHFGKEKKGKIDLQLRFTHQDIASLAGLTRERVSLELEELQKENLISIDKHLITKIKIAELEKEIIYKA